MRRQKGQAFILAVIWLGVGALLITPALGVAWSANRSQRISENALNTMIADGDALRNVLWQLKYQLMGTFTSTPSQVYDFYYQGIHYHTVIQVPSVPPSNVDLNLDSNKTMMITSEPQVIESTDNGTNYVIRFQLQPWSKTSTNGVYEYSLPAGFTYTPNSSYFTGPQGATGTGGLHVDARVNHTTHQVELDAIGSGQWVAMSAGVGINYEERINMSEPPPGGYLLTKSYLIVTTLQNGSQRLRFLPAYNIASAGNNTLITTVHVTGSAWGVHYLTGGSFSVNGDSATFTQAAAIGVAMYTVTIPIGGVNYRVTIAYDAYDPVTNPTGTNTFKIVSYQIV